MLCTFEYLRIIVEDSLQHSELFVQALGRAESDRRVRPNRRIVRAGAWASAALAAVLAGVLLTNAGPDPDAEFERLVAAYASDASGGAWRSPTSGLLEFPGIELIRSIPSVGGPARGLDLDGTPPIPAPGGRENP